MNVHIRRNNDLNSQKCKLTQVFCIFDSKKTTRGSVISDENYRNDEELLVKLQVKQRKTFPYTYNNCILATSIYVKAA